MAKNNTIVPFVFEDGTAIELTLTYYALYQMKAKNEGLYKRYNRIMANGMNEELDMVTILYTAYICAHLNEGVMTEEEFMIGCGSDRKAVAEAVKKLTTPKN